MSHLIRYITVILLVILIAPYFTGSVNGQEKRFRVAVSVQSLGGIINDAFGEVVDIMYILPAGADPHSYQVTPDVIKSLSSIDIFVFTGHFSFEYTIMESYKDKPALYLDIDTGYYGKYKLKLLSFPGKSGEGYNPHGYWLLPDNALKIAAAFRDLLISLDPANSELYNSLFQEFRNEIADIEDMYREISLKYGFSNTYVLLGFPAEEYIVYPLNVTIVNVISRGPGQTITPTELSASVDMLSKASSKYIVASEIAVNMAIGGVLKSVMNQVGCKIIYVDVVGASFNSYRALVYYNLGRIVGGVLSESPSKNEGGNEVNYVLFIFTILLIVVVVIESLYIYFISRVY